MYYNIKIKSNGSEFSLETTHKEVLEREMDLYFAYIFDVSKEFKSKIKKIEITDKNIKSIEEFETPNKIKKALHELSDERIQELAKLKAQEIIKAQQIELEKTQEFDEIIFDEEATNSSYQTPITLKQQIQNNNPPTEIIKFQNTPICIKETETVSENNTSELQLINESQDKNLSDDIMELIQLAQQKIETIEKTPLADIKNNETIELTINKKENEDISSIENQDLISNSTINTPTPNKTFEDNLQELNLYTPEAKEEIINNDANEVSLIDIEVTLTSEENKTPKITTHIQTENTSTKTPLSQIASKMDFGPFLLNYKCEDLADEFIICAYFIKNILKQSNFTMKFINSKLFQATGKIADMSIVDELTTKEYIRIIDTEDGKKYSITMDGENYFATKFQG